MALKNRIGKTRTVPFRITCRGAVEIVVVASGEQSQVEYERFCYPERDSSASEEWTLLDVDSTGDIFSGTVQEASTRGVVDDTLVLDIKAWDANGATEVRRIRILPLVSTKVENIEPTV